MLQNKLIICTADLRKITHKFVFIFVTVANTCEIPTNPEYGQFILSGESPPAVGTVLRLICSIGYHPSSSSSTDLATTFTCNNTENGDEAAWTGTRPECGKKNRAQKASGCKPSTTIQSRYRCRI